MYLEVARAAADGPDRVAIETEDGVLFTYG